MTEVDGAPAVPWVTLSCESLSGTETDLLSLDFDYAGHRVPGLPAVPFGILPDGSGTVRIHRDLAAEQAALETLAGLGFVPAGQPGPPGSQRLVPAATNPIERAGCWSALLREGFPALEAAGWRVDTAEPSGCTSRRRTGTWRSRTMGRPAATTGSDCASTWTWRAGACPCCPSSPRCWNWGWAPASPRSSACPWTRPGPTRTPPTAISTCRGRG